MPGLLCSLSHPERRVEAASWEQHCWQEGAAQRDEKEEPASGGEQPQHRNFPSLTPEVTVWEPQRNLVKLFTKTKKPFKYSFYHF